MMVNLDPICIGSAITLVLQRCADPSGQTALLLLGVIRNDEPHITPAISESGFKAYLRVVRDPGLTVP